MISTKYRKRKTTGRSKGKVDINNVRKQRKGKSKSLVFSDAEDVCVFGQTRFRTVLFLLLPFTHGTCMSGHGHYFLGKKLMNKIPTFK